jgi:hypothetical protein
MKGLGKPSLGNHQFTEVRSHPDIRSDSPETCCDRVPHSPPPSVRADAKLDPWPLFPDPQVFRAP